MLQSVRCRRANANSRGAPAPMRRGLRTSTEALSADPQNTTTRSGQRSVLSRTCPCAARQCRGDSPDRPARHAHRPTIGIGRPSDHESAVHSRSATRFRQRARSRSPNLPQAPLAYSPQPNRPPLRYYVSGVCKSRALPGRDRRTVHGHRRLHGYIGRIVPNGYSTVTDFARLRGWSTSVPFATATWYARSCTGTA